MINTALSVVRPLADWSDAVSVEFMQMRLKLSGLTPKEANAYPISSKFGMGAFCIAYPNERMYRIRYDRKEDKYISPKNVNDIWYAPSDTPETLRAANELFIIEGELKAARFKKQWPDAAVVGIGGAWNFSMRQEDKQHVLLPSLIEILKPDKRVIVIFDGDIETKIHIQMAAAALKRLLKPHLCGLDIFCPPVGKGVDDWLEQTSNPTFADLKTVHADTLAESRSRRAKALGCTFIDDKLVINERNTMILLADFYKDRLFVDRRLGTYLEGELVNIDTLERQSLFYLQETYNARWRGGAVTTAIAEVIEGFESDLVQNLINKLVWDGVERLNTWGSKHFETRWPEYANEWGRILLTGFAMRLLEPGCKVDKVAILAGPQGIGKSTFFEDLSTFEGHRMYFACTQVASSSGDANRTQGMMFKRSTIVDLAEGVVFETRKVHMDTVKQLLTQREDEFRYPYKKSVDVVARGFVFVGTTNRYDQLSDTTGSRRYMYLRVNKITRLAYDEKLQILAEVKHKLSELRNTEWWLERVDIATAPDELKEVANIDTLSVQELINTQFVKTDANVEFIMHLLSSNEVASLKKDTNVKFISSPYLAARAPSTSKLTANMWGRILSSLEDSPTCPYKFERWRLTRASLFGNPAMIDMYMSTCTNSQEQISGFKVTKK